MTIMLKLDTYTSRGHTVTLVSPSEYHYYSGMGPGMLSGMYEPREIRFHIRRMAEERGAAFLEDRVTLIKPGDRVLMLASGEKLPYDVVSFNTGSSIAVTTSGHDTDNVFAVKPIQNLLNARHMIAEKMRKKKAGFVVIGGGPGGVEVSANLWRLLRDLRIEGRITLVCGRGLLVDSPEKVRVLVKESFARKGIRLIEKGYLESIEHGNILVSNEGKIPFDMAFLATGVRPSTIFRDSGMPTGPDGGLLVNRYLHHPSHPEIFGGGDCVSLQHDPLPKVGVHAVRQNSILYKNVLAAMQGGDFVEFRPQRRFMLILNMGDGKGILWRGGFVMDGRISFVLKNYIDRKFMAKFQVSGEVQER